MLAKALAAATASAPKVYVEEVFQSWLYTGTGAAQTITNGIDLSGKGGLTWIKGRSGATGHRFTNTSRGATKSLESNSTAAEATESTGLTSFSSTGFVIGDDADYNTSAATYCSWTFRKAAKFFDVVTYTGTGANRTIAHSLGSVPGAIWVKRTDTTGDWQCYHRSLANTQYMVLNSTAAVDTGATRWNSTTSTSSVFSLGTDATVNASGGTYVAYLFAHDAGGFGTAGTDNVVSCGSYTTDGIGEATVNLGWEPQWLLIKKSSTTAGNSTDDWFLYDNMREASLTGAKKLATNTSNLETINTSIRSFFSTGFTWLGGGASNTYIYIAIRRGPMKTPTVGTQVFDVTAVTQSLNASNPAAANVLADFYCVRTRNAVANWYTGDRLRGGPLLYFDNTLAEGSSVYKWDTQTGVSFSGALIGTSTPVTQAFFRRAPGFFDVVAYTGTGSATTFSHNLGVVPELILVKGRSTAYSWWVYNKDIGNTKYLQLQLDGGASTFDLWNNTSPTSSVFSLSNYASINNSGSTFIAYLFATAPGVSKVGTYTGTGTTKQIDCGFTASARFVLIKRTDSTGDWYTYDTARGIISGNDPFLLLNSTAAEVTNTDYIDPLSSGFEISSTAPAAINANGGTYIFLAIA